MLDTEFIVPDKTLDLCSIQQSTSQYSVCEISSIKDITAELLGFDQELCDQGVEFIFSHFDTFYSITRHFAYMEDCLKLEAFDYLLKVAGLLSQQLPELLQNDSELVEKNTRFIYRNSLKMTVFLLCRLTDAYESDAAKPSVIIETRKKTQKKKGKKRTRKDSYSDSEEEERDEDDNDEADWNSKRMKFFDVITQLFMLDIYKLWEPSAVEQEFVNTVTSTFFKLLENPNLPETDDSIPDEIVDFLGHCLRTYKTEMDYSIKMVQAVQDNPHLIALMSNAVQSFVKKYDVSSFVSIVFQEVAHLEIDENSSDTGRLHQLSQFITEISEKCPEQTFASIDCIFPCLEQDSHIIRNCVISIIGDVLEYLSKHKNPTEAIVKRRFDLIDILLKYLLDYNSFVRSKVIQTARRLIDSNSLQIPAQQIFLNPIIGRLKDKTIPVRKNAISFLKSFLFANPYVARLPLDIIRESYNKENANLAELSGIDEISSLSGSHISSEIDISGESNVTAHVNNIDTSHTSEDKSKNDTDARTMKILEKKILVDYLKRTMDCAESIINTFPWICELLYSVNNTEALEAIHFFTGAFALGLKEAECGIKQILRLINSKDPVIKEAVVDAYKILYLTVDEEENDVNTITARSLIQLLNDATEDDVLAIEKIIVELMKTGAIPTPVIKVLWKFFAKIGSGVTDDESFYSLVILSMAASYNPNIVRKNIGKLVKIGLGLRGKNNYQLVAETCSALVKIRPADDFQATVESEFPLIRLPTKCVIARRVTQFVVKGIGNQHDSRWYLMADKAVSLIFKVVEKPDLVSQEIITRIIKKLKKRKCKGKKLKVMLCRFLYLCGQIIIAFMSYLEDDVYTELKRQENMSARLKKKNKKPKMRRYSTPHKKKKSETSDVTDKNEDIENNEAEAEDMIVNFIRDISEEELLNEKHLYGKTYMFVNTACTWSLSHFDEEITAAASLSLTRLMVVNPVICEDNMQLMISLMENCPAPAIRSNLTIAFADLLVRFPNEVQPYTDYLYNRIHDDDTIVKTHAVVVLCHLVLNDMVKLKGQISEIAVCILSEVKVIADTAKHFFLELSKRKNNALYNVLPDLISNLTDVSCTVSETNFDIIIKYVFDFVDKDKQIEGLVEKLCSRAKDASTKEQFRKIIFGLSLLRFTDKCFRILMDYKACFSGKLDEDDLLKSYVTNILQNILKQYSNLENDVIAFYKEISNEEKDANIAAILGLTNKGNADEVTSDDGSGED